MVKSVGHKTGKTKLFGMGATIGKHWLGGKVLSEKEIAVKSTGRVGAGWIAGVVSLALAVTLVVVGAVNGQSPSQAASTQAAPQSSSQNSGQAPAGQSPAPAPGKNRLDAIPSLFA